ncbi:hypothetical protein EV683_10536 [Crenobacter luteus]|uniref:YmfL family putative regulatory protein n=1 Tax=Crenobacter luteus TaxID=1452487 RepID=UPI00104C031A|nr:YmfL family putative regulatory protein [Crenobacter luteus]TCP13791.1 hypothetical protein EV683_10536 [Crenobacter luteus]
METIRGSLQMMCRAMNGGWTGMAEALGTSVQRLQNRIYARKGQAVSVKTALQMQDASQTTYFAEAVARHSGGVFIPVPPIGDIGEEDIQKKYLQLLERFGEHAREYREAIADRQVCKRERRKLETIGGEICTLTAEINQYTFHLFCKQD